MERLSHSRPTMPLTLRAVSLNDQPITQPITASFGPKGGSIGRADTNTLPLPDPERRISRRQAEIVATGDGFAIKNVGSANPIIVRDQSLALGESAPLRHGDQVRIGGYLLEVIQPSDDGDDRTSLDAPHSSADPFAPIAAAPSPGPAAAPSRSAPAFPPSSPFADLGGPLSTGNPFAELLGDPPKAASNDASSARVRRRLRRPGSPTTSIPSRRRPRQPRRLRGRRPRVGSGAFDDLIPSVAPGSIDSLFGLGSAGTQDPLAAFLAGAPPARIPRSHRAARRCRPIRSPCSAAPATPSRRRPLRRRCPTRRRNCAPRSRRLARKLAPKPVEKPAPPKPTPASATAEPAASRAARVPPAAAAASPASAGRGVHRPARHRLVPRRPRRLERPLRRRRRPPRPAAQHRPRLHARRRHDAARRRSKARCS